MAGIPQSGPHANLESVNPLGGVTKAVDRAASTIDAPKASTSTPSAAHTPDVPSQGRDIYLGTTPGGKTFAEGMNTKNDYLRQQALRGKK